MKSITLQKEMMSFKALLNDKGELAAENPAVKKMQDLSSLKAWAAPTAVERVEVFKECHRLAEELYQLTGSKDVTAQVMRFGEILLDKSRTITAQANY